MGSSKVFLVTGGAGFIGSNFVEMVVEQGHRVVVLDAFTYAGHAENLEMIQPASAWEVVRGDIRDATLVPSLLERFRPTAIVNFAAESHVDRSITNPAAFVETNVLGVFNMLHSANLYWSKLSGPAKADFRFLQVSTDEVYGTLGDTGKFSEMTPYAPNSPYSASKAGGDHLARAWFHTYKMPVITTNCSNNYGPKQYPEKLIPHMINCALQNLPLPVYGNGKNVRDWIHVKDHCRGILRAIEDGVPGETYCFGGNSERTNLQVVEMICRELDEQHPRDDGSSYSKQISFVEDRKGHDWRYAIDDSKAQKALGYDRHYKVFEAGLKDTVQWYLNNQAWMTSVVQPR
jgi:dTDP-glucose 4,6-dehydratase